MFCLLLSSADNFCKVSTKIRSDIVSGLIWIQNCLLLFRFFFRKKVDLLKKSVDDTKACKVSQYALTLRPFCFNQWHFLKVSVLILPSTMQTCTCYTKSRFDDYFDHILVENLRRYVYNGVICGVLMGVSDRFCLQIFFQRLFHFSYKLSSRNVSNNA